MDEDDIENTINTLRELHKWINGGSGFFGISSHDVISRLTTLRDTTASDWFVRADNPATQFAAGIELMTAIFDSHCGARSIAESDRDSDAQAAFQAQFRTFGAFAL